MTLSCSGCPRPAWQAPWDSELELLRPTCPPRPSPTLPPLSLASSSSFLGMTHTSASHLHCQLPRSSFERVAWSRFLHPEALGHVAGSGRAPCGRGPGAASLGRGGRWLSRGRADPDGPADPHVPFDLGPEGPPGPSCYTQSILPVAFLNWPPPARRPGERRWGEGRSGGRGGTGMEPGTRTTECAGRAF